MTCRRYSVSSLLALTSITMFAPSLAPRAVAQDVFDRWREPVVVELELAGATEGDRLRTLDRGRIALRPRESFTVEYEPLDQRGRRFPLDRFEIGVELGRDCSGRISMSETRSGDLIFRASRNPGRCRVLLYVPGNLNLEYELEFDVSGRDAIEYTRREAEEITDRLYLAILQRDVDRSSRSSSVGEIERGRLESLVSSMLDSREFSDIRRDSQPEDLLDAFYDGLLQRAPDSEGTADYLRDIRRGTYLNTILSIVASDEFESGLPRDRGRRR